MSESPVTPTCWTEINRAALGEEGARRKFAEIYGPVIRIYLRARWRDSVLTTNLEDAFQDVFVECFRPAGVLDHVGPEKTSSFRGYLFGVVRNIARRYESKTHAQDLPFDLPANDTSASATFDREYASALMREDSLAQTLNAEKLGPPALKRVELLSLRFGDSLPIREIARTWQVDPAWLHHQYAIARQEFRDALRTTIQLHHPNLNGKEVDDRCLELLQVLAGGHGPSG